MRSDASGVRFEFQSLPRYAQMAPINAIVARDLDGDGALDLVAGSQAGDLSTFLGQIVPPEPPPPPPALPAMSWWGRALLALGMLGLGSRRKRRSQPGETT